MMVRQKIFLLSALLCLATGAHALSAPEAKAIAISETDTRIEALNKAVTAADDKTAAYIQAMADDAVKVAGDKVLVVKDGKATDPVTGAEIALPADAEDIINNNRMRSELDTALAALKLFSKDDTLRATAIQSLLKNPDEGKLPLLDKALASETKSELKAQLTFARAAAMLGSAEKAKRLEAAKALASSHAISLVWCLPASA
jgi:urea transport system permease protein